MQIHYANEVHAQPKRVPAFAIRLSIQMKEINAVNNPSRRK